MRHTAMEVSEYDIREDEEQGRKLETIVELLLAAGYFRARIKNLPNFDKVIGGLTWCIASCNYDLDIDLLYQENSTLGQKIALTEKIVAVLPKMKCPHRIEPHQIQGSDFIHIFPVVQWLVKKVVTTREEVGDVTRRSAILQFECEFTMPDNGRVKTDLLHKTEGQFLPQRRFRRSNPLCDDATLTEHVNSTLLEFGQSCSDYTLKDLEGEDVKPVESSSLSHKVIKSIVGLKSEQLEEAKQVYSAKKRKDPTMDMKIMLHENLELGEALLKTIHAEYKQLCEEGKTVKSLLETDEETLLALNGRLAQATDAIDCGNEKDATQLRILVKQLMKADSKHKEYRAQCEKDMKSLEDKLASARLAASEGEVPATKETIEQLTECRNRLNKVRVKAAKFNRKVATLQRTLDQVPDRAELNQYQRRFSELYVQVNSKHRETKQFYQLYNTLTDSQLYMEKEVDLLNSIHDNYERAMSNRTDREQYFLQLEKIIRGIEQNRKKVEEKLAEVTETRELLAREISALVDVQRTYSKTVEEFQVEFRKHEAIISKFAEIGEPLPM